MSEKQEGLYAKPDYLAMFSIFAEEIRDLHESIDSLASDIKIMQQSVDILVLNLKNFTKQYADLKDQTTGHLKNAAQSAFTERYQPVEEQFARIEKILEQLLQEKKMKRKFFRLLKK